MTTLYTPKNNVRSTLAAAYAAASGAITVATGTGSSFGSPSPTAPIRITVVKAANANTVAESSSNLTVFACTGVTGDVLTVAAIEGSTDRNYSVGDILEARLTAGTISDIHTVLGPYGVLQLDVSGNASGILIPRTGTASSLASTVLAAGELASTTDTFETILGDGSTAGGRARIGSELVADIILDGSGSPPSETSLNESPYNASTNPVAAYQDTAGTGVNMPFMYAYTNRYSSVNLANGTFTAPKTGLYSVRFTKPALIIDNTTGGDPTTDASAKWFLNITYPDYASTYSGTAPKIAFTFAHGASVFNLTGVYYLAGIDTAYVAQSKDPSGYYPPMLIPLKQGQVMQFTFTNQRADTLTFRVHGRVQIAAL